MWETRGWVLTGTPERAQELKEESVNGRSTERKSESGRPKAVTATETGCTRGPGG